MFLYVGGKTNILSESIISVHAYENFKSGNNQDILDQYWEKGMVNMLVDMAEIKSVIITSDGIYLSGISVATLKKRACFTYK